MEQINEWGTEVCQICIEFMQIMAKDCHLSYGFINVLLFIIIQPLCIILYAISAVLGIKNNNNKIIMYFSRTCFFVSTILVISVILTILLIIAGIMVDARLPC